MSAYSMFLLFSEGVLAFISPCVLPMVPVYLFYLMGSSEKSKKSPVVNTLGFILGFTLVYILLGITATALGQLFYEYRLLLQRIGGIIIIIFGFQFLGFFKINFLNKIVKVKTNVHVKGFFSSVLFGLVFSVGWTPCTGPLLGGALVMAGSSKSIWQGIFLVILFCLGLGVPFFITALLYNKLTSVLTFLKKHHKAISVVSGVLLIAVGALLITDYFGLYLKWFNF